MVCQAEAAASCNLHPLRWPGTRPCKWALICKAAAKHEQMPASTFLCNRGASCFCLHRLSHMQQRCVNFQTEMLTTLTGRFSMLMMPLPPKGQTLPFDQKSMDIPCQYVSVALQPFSVSSPDCQACRTKSRSSSIIIVPLLTTLRL